MTDIDDMDEIEGNEDEEESEEDEWEGDENEQQRDEGIREGRRRVPFQSDVENVEFPVSWLAGRSEDTKKPEALTNFVPHFMLYLVGDVLADDVWTSAGGTGVQTVVCQTLPEGLVEEVLLRLPAAAQARCRAVCKAWLAMLSPPEFSRRSFLQALSRTRTGA